MIGRYPLGHSYGWDGPNPGFGPYGPIEPEDNPIPEKPRHIGGFRQVLSRCAEALVALGGVSVTWPAAESTAFEPERIVAWDQVHTVVDLERYLAEHRPE